MSKVLSSEMDPAEIRLTREVVIKEREAWRFFRKISSLPIAQRQNKDHCALANCGGVEFPPTSKLVA